MLSLHKTCSEANAVASPSELEDGAFTLLLEQEASGVSSLGGKKWKWIQGVFFLPPPLSTSQLFSTFI